MQTSQSTNSTADNQPGLIDRVLRLRQRLGSDIPLSLSDPEDAHGCSGEPVMETLGHAQPAYNSRDWLVWSQSPGGENPPAKE
jgi:hypothetical protein